MKYQSIMAVIVFAALSLPASAQAIRELDQAEVRESVQAGKALSLGNIKSIVESRLSGELIDVRAFEQSGIYYRVLIRQPNGKLASAVLNALTGQFVRSDSPVARNVLEAARSAGSGKSANPNAGPGNNNRGGNGNGNAGGNGNGNSGGNGNGNSGGNGGGNGGGNSGGNGGGNNK